MGDDLTDIPITDSRARMGRPPLNRKSKTKLTMIRLTEEMAARIDAVAGENGRAQFIREAIERELERQDRARKKASEE